MKILTLNYEYPPLGGGAGLITARICEQLALLGHEVTVVSTHFDSLPEDTLENGVRVIRLKARREFEYKSNVFEMLNWIKIAKVFTLQYCQNTPPKLIFAHFALPGGAVARFLNKRTDIPYTIMSHGHDIPWYFPRQMFFYHLATWPWLKTICHFSSSNFVQTLYMKKNIDRFTGKEIAHKNIVIPNGCDTRLFPIVNPAKDPVLQILFGGRLVTQKDPFTFLKALILLKNRSVSFHATVTGNGPLLQPMKDFVANNGLADVVSFTGWQTKEYMPQLYARSHVFVLPSLTEGMSVSVLEALCSGLYVIATPVSGNTEMILEGVNGSFVPLKNPEALATAIINFNKKRLTEYPVKTETVEQFRKLNDWTLVAQKYNQILSIIAGSK